MSRRHHAISVVLCHSILLFDLRREHSFVPTAYLHRRRAPRRSRTALLQRRRRLVLDGREHGGRLLAIGWLARAMIRGEPAIGRDQSREPRLYSVEPCRVPTMKQSYASASKAPRRRVHSPSGRGFLCQGWCTPFCRALAPLFVDSFVRPAPRAFFRPDRILAVAVARSEGQGRRFFSAAEGLSLTNEHGGKLPVIGWFATR